MARAHGSISAFVLALIAGVCIAFTAACENTAKGLREDAAQAEVETREERAQAREAARDVRDSASDAARAIGQAAAEAGEELAERTGALGQKIDVKAALMADSSVDATRIGVDVDYRTRHVRLTGYVPTAAERERAEAVAQARAEGFRVTNELVVQPRS